MTEEGDEALLKRAIGDICADADDATPGRDPLEQVPDDAFEQLATQTAAFSSSEVEHALQVSPDGAILNRSVGSTASVVLEPVPGALTAHNHPGNSPPSREDVELMIEAGFSFLLVATRCGTAYYLAPTIASIGEFRLHFNRLFEIGVVVALETRARYNWNISDEELYCRQMHALFSELARRRILCYSRRRWTQTPPAMREPDSSDSGG